VHGHVAIITYAVKKTEQGQPGNETNNTYQLSLKSNMQDLFRYVTFYP